jgi:DNA-binding SARP family transcriptional activator
VSFVAIGNAEAVVPPAGQPARLDLLGPFRLAVDGENIAEGLGRKAQALLAYLAAVPDHRASRERLANLLWGERFDEQARQSLRQTLMALRRSLGATAPGLLLIDRAEVRLDPQAFTTDIAVFTAAMAQPDLARLQDAAALWRGEVLADLDIPSPEYEDWLRDLRETWRLRAVALHMQQARLLLQAGDGTAALLAVSRLVGLDPLNEEARRLELEAVARFRGRAAAVQTYQQFAALLQQELQVAPAAETRALVQHLGRELSPGTAVIGTVIDVAAEPPPGKAAWRRWPAIAAAAVLAIAAGVGALHLYSSVPPDAAGPAAMAPVAAKPPFAFHIAAPAAAGEGAVFWDSLKTRVAMLPVSVLASDRRRAAFVIEGEMQGGDMLMANLRLVDSASGQTMWADRVAVAPAAADRAAADVAVRAYVELLTALQQRQGQLPPVTQTVQDGWTLFSGNMTRERIARARQSFTAVVESTPDDPVARLGLAYSIVQDLLNRWSVNRDNDAVMAAEHLEQAIARVPRNLTAHITVGLLHKTRRDFPRALMAWQVVLAMNPREGSTLAQIAHVNLLMGNIAEGVERAEMAIQISAGSRALDRIYFYAGMGRLLAGDYDVAQEHLARAMAIHPQADTLAWRAAALAQLGRLDEARAMYAELKQRFPWWNIDHHVMQAVDRRTMEHFIVGLDRIAAAAN